jgi:hypothetical protein
VDKKLGKAVLDPYPQFCPRDLMKGGEEVMVGGREGTWLQARITDTARPLETDTKVNVQ